MNFNATNSHLNQSTILEKIFENICGEKNQTLWTREKCSGIKLETIEKMYPISVENFSFYFDANWQRQHQHEDKIDYHGIMQNYCPLIYDDTEWFD